MILSLLALLFPTITFAQCTGATLDVTKPFTECITPKVTDDLSSYTDLTGYMETIAEDLINIFEMLLVIVVIYYGARTIFLSHTGNHKETSLSLTYAFGATIMVLAAQELAKSLTPDVEPISESLLITETILWALIPILKGMLGIALMITMFIQATRLVLSFGTDYMAQARKQITLTVFGTVFVLVAETIVDSITTRSTAPLAGEIVKIINFTAVLFGALCIVGFVIGGFFYAISVQDSLKDRGQKIMLTTAVALLVVMSSWSIIQVFLVL